MTAAWDVGYRRGLAHSHNCERLLAWTAARATTKRADEAGRPGTRLARGTERDREGDTLSEGCQLSSRVSK